MERARPLGSVAGTSNQPTSATSSSYFVPTPVQPPFTTAGRVFLIANDGPAFCSGVAVNTPTRRVVLTAGHCLLELTGPHRRDFTEFLIFVPAYTSGVSPYGEFEMAEAAVPRPWYRSNNPNFDVGMVTTLPNAAGVNVADAVGGGATVAMNISREQEFEIAGYPGWNRQRMKACNGFYLGAFGYFWAGKPQSESSCTLAKGSSGGPWFIQNEAGEYLVDGVTSLGLRDWRDGSQILTSPYFSDVNVGVLLAGA